MQQPSDAPAAPSVTPETKVRQVRGQALVDKVMAATFSELARVGYENLSIEQVAEAAGVNKTTIYRRWNTRKELVQAAFANLIQNSPPEPDTGSFRGDMLAGLRAFRDFATDPATGAVFRMLLNGQMHQDIIDYVKTIAEEKGRPWEQAQQRAIQRGELPAETDFRLFGAIAHGAVQHLVLFMREPCDDEQLGKLLDMILYGVTPRPPQAQG